MRFAEDYTPAELRGIDALYKRKADGETLEDDEAKALDEYESAMQAQQHEYETVNKVIADAGASMMRDAMAYADRLKAAYDELRKSQTERMEQVKR